MKRKQKVLTICRCGRELQGRRWGKPGKKIWIWFAELAGKNTKISIEVRVEECVFCQAHRTQEDGPYGPW